MTPKPDPKNDANIPAGIEAQIAAQAQPPALVDTEHSEWNDVDDGDLSPDDLGGLMPALKMNRKVGGGFVNEDTGEISDTIQFVWLAKSKSRAWWPEDFGKGEAAPACRSNDGLKPDPSSPDLQHDVCATCPHNTFDPAKGERRCVESIEAMVFLPDDLGEGRLGRIRFNGIAITPARAWWQSFGKRGTRVPRRPALSVVTECHLEPTVTKNGEFLAPKFSVAKDLTRAQVAPLIAERDQRIAEWQEYVARDVATRSADADEANGDPARDAGTAAEGGGDFGTEPF